MFTIIKFIIVNMNRFLCFRFHKASINERLIIHERKKMSYRKQFDLWCFFNSKPM